MFLFLDVVSPIPEFHLINDKKVIVSIKIIQNKYEKLSDTIIPKYLEINNIYKINKKLTHLIITTGPGSYTALRVGASFIAGLSQSLDLPLSTVSTENIFEFLNKEILAKGLYLESSKNQRFLLFKKGENFFHQKIECKNFMIPKHINNLFYNIESFESRNDLNCRFFSIVKVITENLNNLEFKKNLIIKPIYISNNSILK
tara:strand:+ start:188 stop:790 length:603 start_codon:yes stop_codon:yes gene_type:complete